MKSKGFIFIKKEFVATTIWPNKQLTLSGVIDLETEYKKALAGKPVQVMDIAVDGSGYLVLGNSETVGTFLWMIEKEDTVGDILPVKWRDGHLIPTGMDPLEEMIHLIKNLCNEKDS